MRNGFFSRACQAPKRGYSETMMQNRWIRLVLAAWMLSGLAAVAEPDAAERKAFDQAKAKADKGDAQAQLQLGSLYATGAGVPRDSVKAFKWHRKAAEQGEAPAQLLLAMEYADGRGVKPDQTEAARWLRKAADQDLLEAQVEFGRFCAAGRGMDEDVIEGARWFRKAADKNMAEAQYQLGLCYFNGEGVTKDIEQAVQWTRKAANQGYGPAQHRLGVCYEKGEGAPKDYQEAYKWFNLAGAQGGDEADEIRVRLAMVARFLTPAQILEAQRLAREFKPASSPAPSTDPAANVGIGFVTVKADDESCEIFADGAFVGNPPAKLKLSEGGHVIEAKKARYKTFRREIKVSANDDLNLRIILEKQ